MVLALTKEREVLQMYLTSREQGSNQPGHTIKSMAHSLRRNYPVQVQRDSLSIALSTVELQIEQAPLVPDNQKRASISANFSKMKIDI